LNSSILI